MILVAQPAPVFVDSTGRRRRLLRRLAYGFGAFCMVYGGLISLSLAGGPVSPSAVLPFPGLAEHGTPTSCPSTRRHPTPRSTAAPTPTRARLIHRAPCPGGTAAISREEEEPGDAVAEAVAVAVRAAVGDAVAVRLAAAGVHPGVPKARPTVGVGPFFADQVCRRHRG